MFETLYNFAASQVFFGALMFAITMFVYLVFNKYLRMESSTSLWFGFFVLLALPFGEFLEALNPKAIEVVINNSPAFVTGVRDQVESTSSYANQSALYLIWLLGFGLSSIAFILLPLFRYAMFLFRSDLVKNDKSFPQGLQKIVESVPVVVSRDESFESPFVYGFVFPKICIPEYLLRTMSEKQLEAIIWHETHHYKNRDNLRNLFSRFVMSVFWFFPPVYFIYSMLLKAEEYTADRYAIKKMGSAQVYSETLVNVSGALNASISLQTYFFNRQDLKERLFMITRSHSNSKRLILTNGVILLSCLLISCSFVGREKQKAASFEHNIEAEITIKRDGKIVERGVIPLNVYGSKVVMYYKPTEESFSRLELEAVMHGIDMVLLKGSYCEGKHKGIIGLRAAEDSDLNCGLLTNGEFEILTAFDEPAKIETQNSMQFDVKIKSIVTTKNQKVSSL
ncbi:MAG: M56 family metallopeptidase [Bdellovibrionales bacterium]